MRLKKAAFRIVVYSVVAASVVFLSAVLLVAVSDDPYVKAVYSWNRSIQDFRTDLRRKPKDVLRFAQVGPGMKVVDLLGGAGYYTELLSNIVGPEGHIHLHNNSLFLRFSAEGLEERLKGGRLANVTRLDSEFADLQLPTDVDLVFMGLCYHDIYVPRDDPTIMTSREEFFPQIWRSLKSGGRILVIDHAAESGSGTTASPWHHRIAEDYAIEDFEGAGFVYLGSIDVLRNPQDDYSLRIWNEQVQGNTDRFVLLFEKP